MNSDFDNICVSVLCAVYNHEKYVKSALEGFVSQITSFKFEVIINDDVSTDSSAAIIQEYARRYPDIIKPIYQKENQFSKGLSPTRDIMLQNAQGKYIALCEGDDYWTDPYKLQKQYDFLEGHPDVFLCCHACCHESKGEVVDIFRTKESDSYIPTEEIITGGGGLCDTCTIFARKEVISTHFEHDTPLYNDFSFLINASILGKVFYINEAMSVYRVCTDNSFTTRMRQNQEKEIIYLKKEIKRLEKLQLFLDNKYSDIIRQVINDKKTSIAWKTGKMSDFLDMGDYFKRMPLTDKLKATLWCISPKLYVKLSGLYHNH